MPKTGNFIRTIALFALAAALAIVAAGTAGAAPAKKSGATLSGAGSSFVAPLVSQWIAPIGGAYGYELALRGLVASLASRD